MMDAPLLTAATASASADDDDDDERKDGKEVMIPDSVSSEILPFLGVAWPVMITCFLEILPGLSSIIIVGQFRDKEELDATALATMFLNVSGISIGVGLATAMDTLCNQAYGAGRPKKLGIYLQRGCVILGCVCVPIVVLSCFAGSMLRALGQPENVSRMAGHFVVLSIPVIPSVYLVRSPAPSRLPSAMRSRDLRIRERAQYELLRKVLQSMEILKPMLFIAIVCNALSIGMTFVLVTQTSLGYRGAAIARSSAQVLMPAVLVAYVRVAKLTDTFWSGWDIRKACTKWKEFLHLGVPGMLMMCLEWWAFEFIAIFSGLLPNATTDIGANAVLINMVSLVYMFYLGVSIASAVRVGNFLGANKPENARRSSVVSLLINVSMSCLIATSLYLARHQVPVVFTTDRAIRKTTTDTVWIFALFQILDSMNASFRGIMQGAGVQLVGSVIIFVAYYLFSLPMAALLTFGSSDFGTYHKLSSLWIGVASGLFLSAILCSTYISRVNWVDLAKDARIRVMAGKSIKCTPSDDENVGDVDDDDDENDSTFP